MIRWAPATELATSILAAGGRRRYLRENAVERPVQAMVFMDLFRWHSPPSSAFSWLSCIEKPELVVGLTSALACSLFPDEIEVLAGKDHLSMPVDFDMPGIVLNCGGDRARH